MGKHRYRTTVVTKLERSRRILQWAENNLPLWWDIDLNMSKWDAMGNEDLIKIVEQMKEHGIYNKYTPSHYLAKSLPAHFRFCANKLFGTHYDIDRSVTGWEASRL